MSINELENLLVDVEKGFRTKEIKRVGDPVLLENDANAVIERQGGSILIRGVRNPKPLLESLIQAEAITWNCLTSQLIPRAYAVGEGGTSGFCPWFLRAPWKTTSGIVKHALKLFDNWLHTDSTGQYILLPQQAIDVEHMKPNAGMPIDPDRLSEFVKRWQDDKYPMDILRTLLKNIRHIGEKEFDEALAEMADHIEQFVGKEPFVLVSYKIEESSGGLVTQKLIQLLAEKSLIPKQILGFKENLISGENVVLIKELRDKGYKIIYVDDATYNNRGQVVEVLDVLDRQNISLKNVGGFL